MQKAIASSDKWWFAETFSAVLAVLGGRHPTPGEYIATRELWNKRTAIRVIEPTEPLYFPKQFYFIPLAGRTPGSRQGIWSPLQSDLFATDWFILNLKDLNL